MWPDNRLCELLGIEHPIIQAPMVGSCTPELAATISNAGGLGSLGCGELPVEKIKGRADQIRKGTNKPFNLNFFVRGKAETSPEILDKTRKHLQPYYNKLALGEPPKTLPQIGPSFDETRMAFLLELRPAVVSFHFGVPSPDNISALKSAGIKLICSATNVSEARQLEVLGMDAIIAQGWEAGGHRGSFERRAPADAIGGLSLIPQIADAVSVPIIAAGGIADGRGIAAAFALGAAGVQLGTAFLSCPEANTEEIRRNHIRNASDTDTMMTDAYSGRAARAMRSRFAEEFPSNGNDLPDFGHMYALSNPLRQAGDDQEASFYLFGQSAALNKELPAADLLAKLVEETQNVMKKFARAL